MPKEEVRAALGRELDPRAFNSILNRLAAENLLVVEGSTVRLADFEVKLSERQEALIQRIAEIYRRCGIATPTIEEVCRDVKAPPISSTGRV